MLLVRLDIYIYTYAQLDMHLYINAICKIPTYPYPYVNMSLITLNLYNTRNICWLYILLRCVKFSIHCCPSAPKCSCPLWLIVIRFQTKQRPFWPLSTYLSHPSYKHFILISIPNVSVYSCLLLTSSYFAA